MGQANAVGSIPTTRLSGPGKDHSKVSNKPQPIVAHALFANSHPPPPPPPSPPLLLFTLRRLKESRRSLGEVVASQLRSDFYSVQHSVLASMPVTEVVTTNYDTLMEDAIQFPGEVLGGAGSLARHHHYLWDASFVDLCLFCRVVLSQGPAMARCAICAASLCQ